MSASFFARTLVVLATVSFILVPSAAEACRVGSKSWANGCRTKCTANWNGSCNNSCVWNAPAGRIIVDTKEIVHNESNGGYGVSLLSKDAQVEVYESALNELQSKINAAASRGDDRAKAKYEEQYKTVAQYKARYTSNMNTLIVKVNANGHNNPFDRKRGWADVQYKALLECVGKP